MGLGMATFWNATYVAPTTYDCTIRGIDLITGNYVIIKGTIVLS